MKSLTECPYALTGNSLISAERDELSTWERGREMKIYTPHKTALFLLALYMIC